MDYGKTLNLPKTDFPMRANLPQKEPELLKKWEDEGLYKGLLQKNSNKPLFILHDGPPYANGDIHLGHTLNKILKDIVIRHKNMDGCLAPYVPGWDTHGLPIERQAIKLLGIDRHEAGPVKFRQVCRDFALKYVDNQREQFKRLGVIGDWENPYLTLSPEYEARQIELFGTMARKGFIYKGLKPVYWCTDCETALAEAEIEYRQDKTDSIYVKFKVKDGRGKFSGIAETVYFVIWTTTTWTLPGNVAICLNPDFEYSLVKNGNEAYIVASELVQNIGKAAGITDYSVIATYKGSDLEYITCEHPFLGRDSLVILGDHVTLEAGTGCVHTAPGHGAEDYEVCLKYHELPIVVPVDDKGYLTKEAGPFAGLFYSESNEKIIEALKDSGALLAVEAIDHQYPHCWRCKHPIVFRATEQWFASVEGFKADALKAIKDVEWIPGWGQDRISSMVSERTDWCISRQRVWGVPLPIFYCKECGKELITDQSIKAVADLFRREGSDAWFIRPAEEILPAGTRCECGCGSFKKETDIMDVWFDSGSSHGAVLETREGLRWPADMYLEGNDQYRGWFQSSLLVAVANYGKAPYKTVLTHGFVIDLEGKKMSKSAGNGIDPQEIIKDYGADILRMWVASADYKTDVRISMDIIKQLSESYRKIRNTARYILGNINDFDPNTDSVAYADMLELDRWALSQLNKLVEKVNAAYRRYEYHILFHAVHNFCVVDMSNFYLDIIKDRLYTERPASLLRRSAQTAMFEILDSLVRMISPVLAFTSEEIWQFMPHRSGDDTRSVLYNSMPSVKSEYNAPDIDDKYSRLLDLRSDVAKALENARASKLIGQSLAASVELFASGKEFEFLKKVEKDLPVVFITSGVKIIEGPAPQDAEKGQLFGNIGIKVSQAPGEKCERCWVYSETVGKNAAHPTLCDRCSSVIDN